MNGGQSTRSCVGSSHFYSSTGETAIYSEYHLPTYARVYNIHSRCYQGPFSSGCAEVNRTNGQKVSYRRALGSCTLSPFLRHSETKTSLSRMYHIVQRLRRPIVANRFLPTRRSGSQPYPAQPSLSKLRYWMASARCSVRMSGLPLMSAMVRLTFRMRS